MSDLSLVKPNLTDWRSYIPDDVIPMQDCLQKFATEGQKIGGFIQELIFQHFFVNPETLDAHERWVRPHLEDPGPHHQLCSCNL